MLSRFFQGLSKLWGYSVFNRSSYEPFEKHLFKNSWTSLFSYRLIDCQKSTHLSVVQWLKSRKANKRIKVSVLRPNLLSNAAPPTASSVRGLASIHRNLSYTQGRNLCSCHEVQEQLGLLWEEAQKEKLSGSSNTDTVNPLPQGQSDCMQIPSCQQGFALNLSSVPSPRAKQKERVLGKH